MRFLIISIIAALSIISGYATAANGVIKGVITNKNTSKGVPYAVVVVKNNTTLSAVANEKGEYLIESVKSGYNSLVVTALGYVTHVTDNFQVSAASPQIMNIEIDPLSVDIGEVVVTSSPYSSVVESPLSNFAIRKQELEKSPGGGRDISKVVQVAPGVVPSQANRNDLLVRGGGANENRYYLDGIEIPILNHFAVQGGSGGNASLVNTDFLAGATLFTSAFPIYSANALSSVIDMELSEGNNERLKGKFSIGASDLAIAVDTPISKDKRTTMIASYRRSYLQLLFSALGLPFLPTYNDYQAKITHKIDDKSKLTFLIIGSFDNNKLNNSIENPDDKQRYMLGYIPNNDQSSYTAGAVYNRKINDNSSLRLVISHNYFNNYLYKYTDNDPSLQQTVDILSKESDNRFRAEYNISTPNRYRFLFGTSLDYGNYNSQNFQYLYINNQQVTQNFDSKLNKLDYGVFAQISKSYFNGHLSTSLGLRADGSSYNSNTSNPLEQISPRLSAIYRIDEKWALNGLIARYFALPSYTTLGYRDSNGELANRDSGVKYTSVKHYVAGVSFTPNSSSKLSIEGFFKQYKNFPVSLIDSLPLTTSNFEDYTVGDIPIISTGVGRAYGGEFSYRNSDIKNSVINISYTLLYSEFKRPDENLQPSGAYEPSSWDTRYIFNLVAMHTFPKNWDLGIKWRYSSGSPYTPYDQDMSSKIEAWDSRNRAYVDYSLFNNYRFEPYHQLDIRVDKQYFFNKWSLGVYFDIQNLYNYSIAGQEILIPESNSDGEYIIDETDPTRYKMKSIENTLNGTILPTLGIIIEF